MEVCNVSLSGLDLAVFGHLGCLSVWTSTCAERDQYVVPLWYSGSLVASNMKEATKRDATILVTSPTQITSFPDEFVNLSQSPNSHLTMAGEGESEPIRVVSEDALVVVLAPQLLCSPPLPDVVEISQENAPVPEAVRNEVGF